MQRKHTKVRFKFCLYQGHVMPFTVTEPVTVAPAATLHVVLFDVFPVPERLLTVAPLAK